jgi:hypothetical protein
MVSDTITDTEEHFIYYVHVTLLFRDQSSEALKLVLEAKFSSGQI